LIEKSPRVDIKAVMENIEKYEIEREKAK